MTRSRADDGTFIAKREPGESLTREELAGMLSDTLRKLHARITATRFVAKETDKVLMEIVRGFATCAAALNQLLRDEELEKIDARLSELEALLDAKQP